LLIQKYLKTKVRSGSVYAADYKRRPPFKKWYCVSDIDPFPRRFAGLQISLPGIRFDSGRRHQISR
jgi:hypothetical protein